MTDAAIDVHTQERELLTILLDEPFALGSIADFELGPVDFSSTTHRVIFAAIKSIYKRGDHPGLATVSSELERRPALARLEPGELEAIAAEIVPAHQLPGLVRHVKVASLNRLADVHADQKKYEEAATFQRRARELWTSNGHGPLNGGEMLSDALKEQGPSESIFKTAREVGASTPEHIEWAVKPWVVAGGITELDAKIKVGKSEWVAHMVRATLDGLPFMGDPTRQSPVVYLTEQPPRSFRETLRRADLLDRDDLHILFWHDTLGVDWPAIVKMAVHEARSQEAGLLIVDTLPQFSGLRGDEENNSGAALEAMEPLQAAAADHNLAIIVVRHEGKRGGDVGDSGRGSSAFGGSVDIILSLRRGDGNARPTVRVIHALSRFDETPDTLVIELTDKGFVSLGDELAVAASEARAAILDVAPATPDSALTKAELLDRLDNVKSTTAQITLKELLDEGALQRTGEGKKGSPYRYWRIVSDGPTGGPSERIKREEHGRLSSRGG